MSKNTGRDLSILDKKERKAAETAIHENDVVKFVLKSTGGQGLVALADRVIIVKTGFMAGATFGDRVTSIPYQDVSSIQVNKGMVNATIAILAAGFGATNPGDFFSSGKNDDPWKLPNCLPANKSLLKEFEPFLSELRTMVAASKSGSSAGGGFSAQAPDMASQLARLAELHAQGMLSEEEFVAAKMRLIEG